MALFGRKKEIPKKETQTVRSVNVDPNAVQNRDLPSVLVAPRITEKSTSQNDAGVYTFVVRKGATKYDVRDAVRLLFKVTPRKITIVNRPARTTHSRARSRMVTVPGLRKANIFLKKGDRIDLV